jgi:Zn-dependent M32 family carboxypeptidase
LLSEDKFSNKELASWFSKKIEEWMDVYLSELKKPGFLQNLHWHPYTVGGRIG